MELLIIVPFKEVSAEIPVLEDSAWLDIANTLAGYKTRTGISAEVMTLDEINDSYEGRDEPERVKRAIYDGVLNRDVRYVMLVGDAEVFPTRYILRGYTAGGDIWYYLGEDCVRTFNMYRSSACDAYYANLWHSDDPTRAFDDWDADGDSFFGENYLDNIRGIDNYSIHPQVALGRVPCKDPLEFRTYVDKVIIYENRVSIDGRRNEVLLVSGIIAGDCNTFITDLLGSEYDVTTLCEQPDGTYVVEDAGGTSSPVTAPWTYISRFIDGYQPQFVNYAGHGSPNAWSEVPFSTADADSLGNVELPAIVTSTGCETAKFAADQRRTTLPTAPFTGSDLMTAQDSMAEAFVTSHAGGAVIYIGAVVGTRLPPGNYFVKSLYQSIADGVERIGDSWQVAMDAFIAHFDLDRFTASAHLAVPEFWPAPQPDFIWDPHSHRSNFYHIMNYHLFGDPSLRVNGVSVPDRRPPVTTAMLGPWVNKADLEEVLAGGFHLHEVLFSAVDWGGSGVASTNSRYRVDNRHRSPWRGWAVGSVCRIVYGFGYEPLHAGMDGRVAEVEYYSVDRLGNIEAPRTVSFGYDFTPPRSEAIIDGELAPSGIAGEITYVEPTITIRATDENSGVRCIYYSLSGVGEGLDSSPGPFERVPGTSFEVPLNPCFRGSFVLTHFAEDRAGNIEESRQVEFSVGSSLDWSIEVVCLEWLVERPYQFPPRWHDERIDLVFTEKVAGLIPDKVCFEFSGPVTPAYDAHRWELIGSAKRYNETANWVCSWDTHRVGIENDWYWVRAVSTLGRPASGSQQRLDRPFLVLINNLTSDHYTVKVHVSTDVLKPGEQTELTVLFENRQLGDLENVEIGVITDPGLWKEQDRAAYVHRIKRLRQGEKRRTKFEFTLGREFDRRQQIALQVYVRSEDLACLLSKKVDISLVQSDVSVQGTVVDPLDKKLPVKVTLEGRGARWVVETDDSGHFRFDDVTTGAYSLGIAASPSVYRIITPPTGKYQIEVQGRNMTRNFVLAAPDTHAPTITPELTWCDAVRYGCIYGLVYDDHYGTGVNQVWLAVADDETGLWLTPDGNWVKHETWMKPDKLVSIADLQNMLPFELFNGLTRKQRKIERHRLLHLANRLNRGGRCAFWHCLLPDSADLGKGIKVVKLRANDKAGNEVGLDFRDTTINANFSVKPSKGKVPLEVRFADKSQGISIGQLWEFGDGESSVEQNPTHTYNKPGSYTVTLAKMGVVASDEVTKECIVHVKS